MLAHHSTCSAFFALVVLCSGCSTTPTPHAVSVGDWHISGGSSGLFQIQDGGDFGDRDTIAAEFTGGRFTSERMLVEGIFSASREAQEMRGAPAHLRSLS